MNANEICFSIEFETTLPASGTTPIGPYHNGTQVPWLPQSWNAERDGSIKSENISRKGCEFVSPKLCGYERVREIENAINAISARDAKVNASCGLHLTLTWDGDSRTAASTWV